MESRHRLLAELGSRLDRSGGKHLYLQIAELLREQAAAGGLQPGDVLPTQRELSTLWGIGQVTIRRALQSLAAEGLLEARAGSGTAIRGGEARPPASSAERGPRLGIAFADLADGYPFFPPLLAGLRAGGRSVAVRLFDMPPDEHAAGSLAHAPPLNDLDGLIMLSPVNLGLLATCQQRRLPTVLLFNDLADGFSHCVVPDYTHGVMQAVQHLVERGRHRIALVTATAERFSTSRWVDAFRTALVLHGSPADGELILHAGYSERAGAEAARTLLSRPSPPDAILFASDAMARGGLLAARHAGVRVPEDLAIVGAGWCPEQDQWAVPLTTIDLGIEAMGERARRLIEAAGTGIAPVRETVPTRLMVGATS